MEELTVRIDIDVGYEYACVNCERELKELIEKGILVNDEEMLFKRLRIPEGFALIFVPDSNSAVIHYHIELIDRMYLKWFPHPMQWICPVCGRHYKTKGRFKNHLAKEYNIPTETIALLDDALMQKGFKKALKKKW